MGWLALVAALSLAALSLVAVREQFDWARELADIPALRLAFGMALSGLAVVAMLPLVARTEGASPALQRRVVALVVVAGCAFRLAMLATEPALEDDQQRYLVEGALVAHGISPYRVAPADLAAASPDTPLGRIAERAGLVLDRVNHARLRTIYPPVAQAAFALAHVVGPFSLTAWRAVLLLAELGALALLVVLLDHCGMSRIRVALYWINPLVIKEVMNSGHMEGVLTPFVLLAVLAAARRRPIWSASALGLAIGVKVWPVLLAPLLARIFPARMVAGMVAVIGALSLVWLLPILSAGLDQGSGFVAYAQRWQANSALLPALRDGLAHLMGLDRATAGAVARALLAGAVGLVALGLAVRPIAGPADLLRRLALVTFVLVLASPAQFPWYAIWTFALLPFAPRLSVALMAVTLPLYYVSFHYSAIGAFEVFRDRIVWLIWLPVWLAASVELAGWLRCGARARAYRGAA